MKQLFAASSLRLSAVALFLSSVGCSILDPASLPERSILALAPRVSCPEPARTSLQGLPSLLLLPPRASALLASEQILYEKAAGSLASFQLASFAELPTVSLARHVQEQLECSGLFQTVTREQSLTRTEFALATELSVLVFTPYPAPGSSSLKLRAELIEINSREAIAHRVFSLQEFVQESNAPGAVRAHTRLLERLALELSSWLGQVLQERAGALPSAASPATN